MRASLSVLWIMASVLAFGERESVLAQVRVDRPEWTSGQFWTYLKCGIQIRRPFDWYYELDWRTRVIGKGDYLGFRNVYTVEQSAGRRYRPQREVTYARREVLDRDLNIIAGYSGDTVEHINTYRMYRWPLMDGKTWTFTEYSQYTTKGAKPQLGYGGKPQWVSGRVQVQGLYMGGEQYVQLSMSRSWKRADGEERQRFIEVWDRFRRLVAIASAPEEGQTAALGPNALCLEGHPLHNEVR